MRSNPCLEDELKYMRRLYRADRPENSRKLADLKAFYQVKESYINTVFDVIEKKTEELKDSSGKTLSDTKGIRRA